METIEHLVQTLLLTSLVPSTAHRFSGKLFHAYLSGSLALPDNSTIVEQMWQACWVGLVEAFREDRAQGKEKRRPNSGNAAAITSQKTKQGRRKAGFSLLTNLDE